MGEAPAVEFGRVGTSTFVTRRLVDRRWQLAQLLTVAVAVVARLGILLRDGGIHGIMGYDCGVYFSGSDALLHGRLPYRDFTMVHPPGITVLLTPFAALTYVMSDWHAFIVATLAFCLLGGVNALLVIRLCRRFGIGRRGALVAGMFYATWFCAIEAEFQIKLEPLGNLFLLLGLLAAFRAQRVAARRADLLAGLVIGLTVAVKVWWVLPVALFVLWHGARSRSVGAAVRMAVGALTSAAVVILPFFLANPSGMLQSVVFGQLGRQRRYPLVERLSGLSTVGTPFFRTWADTPQVVGVVGSVLFVLCFVMVVVLAWRAVRAARFMVLIVIVQLTVLLAAPTWFEYYGDYLAVALAVTIGAAASALRRDRLPRRHAYVTTAGVAVIAALLTVTGTQAARPYPGAAQMTRAVQHEKCVTTNNPTVLLRLNALSRGLADGCPNWIDITGTTFVFNTPAKLAARHQTWPGQLYHYLNSGDATVVWSPNVRYLQLVQRRLEQHDKVLFRIDGTTIYKS